MAGKEEAPLKPSKSALIHVQTVSLPKSTVFLSLKPTLIKSFEILMNSPAIIIFLFRSGFLMYTDIWARNVFVMGAVLCLIRILAAGCCPLNAGNTPCPPPMNGGCQKCLHTLPGVLGWGRAGENPYFKASILSDVTKAVSYLESISWARALVTKTEIARRVRLQEKSSCGQKREG